MTMIESHKLPEGEKISRMPSREDRNVVRLSAIGLGDGGGVLSPEADSFSKMTKDRMHAAQLRFFCDPLLRKCKVEVEMILDPSALGSLSRPCL